MYYLYGYPLRDFYAWTNILPLDRHFTPGQTFYAWTFIRLNKLTPKPFTPGIFLEA